MIKSPCIAVCKIDYESGYCLGCNRTIEEITNWNLKDDEQKIIITKKAQNRELLLKKQKNKKN